MREVYIDGECRYNHLKRGEVAPQRVSFNNFNHAPIEPAQLNYYTDRAPIPVIAIQPNEIITKLEYYTPKAASSNFEGDIEGDILKIVYINRYTNGAPQVAFCRGFGIKRGAIASSIGHNSHNIVAVGCSDHEISEAVNTLIDNRGALVAYDGR